MKSRHFESRNDRSWKIVLPPLLSWAGVLGCPTAREVGGARLAVGWRALGYLLARSGEWRAGVECLRIGQVVRSIVRSDSPNFRPYPDLNFFAAGPFPPLPVACPRFVFPPLSTLSRAPSGHEVVLACAVLRTSWAVTFEQEGLWASSASTELGASGP